MNKLLIIVLLSIASTAVIADQCQDIASQPTNGMQDAMNKKYALQAAGCGGQQQSQEQQSAPIQSPPQYVPSIGQWCQVVNGVQNCWK